MPAQAMPTRQTTRDLVAEVLRQQILRGVLKPNERLAVPDIALRLGVSQTPAREALQLLESERLVRIDAYKGARVSELDPDDCEELFFLRVALEPTAARLGAEQLSDRDLGRIGELVAEMTEAAATGDVDRFIEADWSFHEVHFEASGRPRLVELIMDLRRESERYTRSSYEAEPGRLKTNLTEHRLALPLLAKRDGAGAEKWTRTLLTDAATAVQRGLVASPAAEERAPTS